ncbi:hypothetical protein NEPAR08_2472 [Nematocida parisii]|nr:hypothetical protein NEPAR08_2472 [Nematocida parisii]KAI5138221.1 hypothetical protein NEAUS07_2337 [Nematocida ausubeli]KAI5151632.1 hypothetical protein ENBRE01_2274 [Enteropsectra breve]
MSRRTAGAHACRAVERTRAASNCERAGSGALRGRRLVSRPREAGRTARARKGPRGGAQRRPGAGLDSRAVAMEVGIREEVCRNIPAEPARAENGRRCSSPRARAALQEAPVARRRACGEGRQRWRLEGARAQILEGVADLGAKGRRGEGFPQERAGPKRRGPRREGEASRPASGSDPRASTPRLRALQRGICGGPRSDALRGEEAGARRRGA